MAHWVLAVDFGTSNTAAAACRSGEPQRARAIKLASASTEMPSGVLAHRDGRLVVGEVARNSAAAAPADAYEPNPKSRVGEGQLLLGGRSLSDIELVAAVLVGAASRAGRQFDDTRPSELRLTHPAAWAGHRVEVLVQAAALAGLPAPVLIPEPVAAAAYYAAQHDGHVPQGPLAVYDIGGGTVDIAVMHRQDGGFVIDAVHGVDPLGGEVFDQRLLALVSQALTARGRADLWTRFDERDAAGRRRTLHDEVRRAKHTLSEEQTADVAVGIGDETAMVTLTRDEFEAAITPDIAPSLSAAQAALRAAGTTSDQLGALYLVGGSSFIPLVSRLLATELGLTPATFDDPKTITALGALHATGAQTGPAAWPPPPAAAVTPPAAVMPDPVPDLGSSFTAPVLPGPTVAAPVSVPRDRPTQRPRFSAPVVLIAAAVVLGLGTSLRLIPVDDEDGWSLLIVFVALAAFTAGMTLARGRALRIGCGVGLAAVCVLNVYLAPTMVFRIGWSVEDGFVFPMSLSLVGAVLGGVWLLVSLMRARGRPRAVGTTTGTATDQHQPDERTRP